MARYERAMTGGMPEPRSSTKIVEIRRLAADVLQVSLASPPGFSWLPGQHLGVSNEPAGQLSYYSIASAWVSSTGSALELAMRESSIKWPLPMQIGQDLFVSRPAGGPPQTNVQTAAHLVLIGMGTGVAPLRSLVQARRALERSETSGSRITLLQGARRVEECLFFDEFTALASSSFEYRPVLSRMPLETWTGRRGHVQDHLDDLQIDEAYFCICGKLAMVEDATVRLGKMGVSTTSIFSEGY